MASELEVGTIKATPNTTTGGVVIDASGQTNTTARLELKADRPSADQDACDIRFYNNNAAPLAHISAVKGSGANDTDGKLDFYTSNAKRLTLDSTGTATISKPQQTTTGTPFSGAALKLLPPSGGTTNTTGVSSIALSTSVTDNYGFLISGHRAGSSGTPTLRVSSHNNSNTGTEVLTISSTGLATFSGGIKAEKGILSGTVLIDDEGVTTITPPRKGGFMKLIVDSATAEAGQYPQNIHSGEVFFDCGSSLGILKCDLHSQLGAQLDVIVSNLTGTTGTNGNVTIGVQSDVIKIENQSGYQYRFNYFLYC